MLTFNLLPSEQKKYLGYEMNRRIIIFSAKWLVFIGILFVILALPSYFFITSQKTEIHRTHVIEEQARQLSQLGSIKERAKEINELTGVVVDREAKRYRIAPFVLDVFNRVPAGVIVTFLGYTQSPDYINIQGHAATRSALLFFTKKLEEGVVIEKVTLPIEYLTKENDITFSLTVKRRS